MTPHARRIYRRARRRLWTLRQQAVVLVRLPTAGRRVLPDFLIAGAQKSGTSSLYRYLCEHPNVVPAREKEIHYFDRDFAKGVRWYRASFPTRSVVERRRRHVGDPVLTGESSPSYTFDPLAPARITALRPDVRVILVLRDPVERAWSHYRAFERRGREDLSFDDALDAEAAEVVTEGTRPHRSYARRGDYDEQVRRWLELIPREQLLVLQSERLFDDPQDFYDRVLEFLGLPQHTLAAPRAVNADADPRPIEPEVRDRLIARYRPRNERLFDLLGERFDWQ